MRKVCKKKVLNDTTAEQLYNLEKYKIMNMKSITLNFMWCAQSSDGKVRNVANQL